MKNFILVSLLLSLFGYSKPTFSQNPEKGDSLGLPGDNLNLYVVLQLFQESKTLEEFEKKLNQESLNVNNLDLNNDDKIDYIKVIDNKTDGAHAIVLQTPINDKETQDIAVIEVEKDKSGKAVVQVVGNEVLYGKDYIIEPKENDSSAKLADSNKNVKEKSASTKVYVSINFWPIIEYIYAPDYVIYVSPWYWSYYPSWWYPWTPWYWNRYYYHHYHHHHHHYYGYYHRTYVYRNQGAHTYYGPRRSTSTYVQRNRTEGRYNRTYKREPINTDKPSRPNPGYQKPTVRPTRDNNQVSPQNPKVNPKKRPTTKPQTRPATRPEAKPTIRPTPKPEVKPKSNPAVNPRINKPTQQPKQNRPSRPPGQNKGTGKKDNM